jgi:hypothetical protein
MLPAFLIRADIDWIRHNERLKTSNPYSRCQEAIDTCDKLWLEQLGYVDRTMIEPAVANAYWEEFFHADDPLPDEKEWKEGLIKRSSQYDSFQDWQTWFKHSYAKVYVDNNIWTSVLMTAWANTHQYDVRFQNGVWDFVPNRSYLPTQQMWRLEPHLETVTTVLTEIWLEAVEAYSAAGFKIRELSSPYLGRVECLGFDTNTYIADWPAKAKRKPVELAVGEMVADIVLPTGDNWYRHLDNVIFAQDSVDITALVNRAQYILASKRRLMELLVSNDTNQSKMQAAAEGWLVQEDEKQEKVS